MRVRPTFLVRLLAFWTRSTDAIADGEARFWRAPPSRDAVPTTRGYEPEQMSPSR